MEEELCLTLGAEIGVLGARIGTDAAHENDALDRRTGEAIEHPPDRVEIRLDVAAPAFGADSSSQMHDRRRVTTPEAGVVSPPERADVGHCCEASSKCAADLAACPGDCDRAEQRGIAEGRGRRWQRRLMDLGHLMPP